MNIFRTSMVASGLVLAAGLSGCMTTPEAVSFKGTSVSTVNGISMSCSNPYPLAQDCSVWSGATLRIKAGDRFMKVSGSAEGRTVFVMAEKSTPTQLELEQAVDAVQAAVAPAGAKTVKIEAVTVGNIIVGYILTFDADAYTTLKRLAAPAA